MLVVVLDEMSNLLFLIMESFGRYECECRMIIA